MKISLENETAEIEGFFKIMIDVIAPLLRGWDNTFSSDDGKIIDITHKGEEVEISIEEEKVTLSQKEILKLLNWLDNLLYKWFYEYIR